MSSSISSRESKKDSNHDPLIVVLAMLSEKDLKIIVQDLETNIKLKIADVYRILKALSYVIKDKDDGKDSADYEISSLKKIIETHSAESINLLIEKFNYDKNTLLALTKGEIKNRLIDQYYIILNKPEYANLELVDIFTGNNYKANLLHPISKFVLYALAQEYLTKDYAPIAIIANYKKNLIGQVRKVFEDFEFKASNTLKIKSSDHIQSACLLRIEKASNDKAKLSEEYRKIQSALVSAKQTFESTQNTVNGICEDFISLVTIKEDVSKKILTVNEKFQALGSLDFSDNKDALAAISSIRKKLHTLESQAKSENDDRNALDQMLASRAQFAKLYTKSNLNMDPELKANITHLEKQIETIQVQLSNDVETKAFESAKTDLDSIESLIDNAEEKMTFVALLSVKECAAADIDSLSALDESIKRMDKFNLLADYSLKDELDKIFKKIEKYIALKNAAFTKDLQDVLEKAEQIIISTIDNNIARVGSAIKMGSDRSVYNDLIFHNSLIEFIKLSTINVINESLSPVAPLEKLKKINDELAGIEKQIDALLNMKKALVKPGDSDDAEQTYFESESKSEHHSVLDNTATVADILNRKVRTRKFSMNLLDDINLALEVADAGLTEEGGSTAPLVVPSIAAPSSPAPSYSSSVVPSSVPSNSSAVSYEIKSSAQEPEPKSEPKPSFATQDSSLLLPVAYIPNDLSETDAIQPARTLSEELEEVASLTFVAPKVLAEVSSGIIEESKNTKSDDYDAESLRKRALYLMFKQYDPNRSHNFGKRSPEDILASLSSLIDKILLIDSDTKDEMSGLLLIAKKLNFTNNKEKYKEINKYISKKDAAGLRQCLIENIRHHMRVINLFYCPLINIMTFDFSKKSATDFLTYIKNYFINLEFRERDVSNDCTKEIYDDMLKIANVKLDEFKRDLPTTYLHNLKHDATNIIVSFSNILSHLPDGKSDSLDEQLSLHLAVIQDTQNISDIINRLKIFIAEHNNHFMIKVGSNGKCSLVFDSSYSEKRIFLLSALTNLLNRNPDQVDSIEPSLINTIKQFMSFVWSCKLNTSNEQNRFIVEARIFDMTLRAYSPSGNSNSIFNAANSKRTGMQSFDVLTPDDVKKNLNPTRNV